MDTIDTFLPFVGKYGVTIYFAGYGSVMSLVYYKKPSCLMLPLLSRVFLAYYGIMLVTQEAWAIFPFGYTLLVLLTTKRHVGRWDTYWVWKLP